MGHKRFACPLRQRTARPAVAEAFLAGRSEMGDSADTAAGGSAVAATGDAGCLVSDDADDIVKRNISLV